MEDGLGLVFEKQGNTGAAAYNQPSLRMGDTSMDRIANNLSHQYLIQQQQKAIEDRQKAAEKRQQEAALQPKELQGWEIQDTHQLGSVGNSLKDAFVALKTEGVDPSDYTNPKARKYQELLSSANQLAGASKFQKKEYYDVVTQLENDGGKNYDRDATMAAINANADLPIEQRKPFKSLIVVKEQPFDSLEPLKDFDIKPYVGSFGTDTPTGGSSGSTLNKTNLRADIDALANNPINDENYEQGIKAGTWDSRKEYADWLYQNAERKYTADYKKVVKAPKGVTLIDINNGSTADQLAALGVGEQTAEVTMNDASGNPIITKGKNSDGESVDITKTAITTIPNSVTLGQINVDIPAASAINASTGQPVGGTKSLKIISGTMGTPLVYKAEGRVVPLGAGELTYKDKSGKWVTIKGTKKELADKLIEAGVAEYKPMILGVAESPNVDDNSKTDKTTVWLPANTVIHGTDKKDKALSSGEQAYYILDKAAKEKNGSAGESTTYSVKGKTYTKDAIQKAADASGMTIDEYLKAIGG